VGVDESISAMTAVLRLQIWALAPIQGVICSTGGHTYFVRSKDAFLSDLDVSFVYEIRLPVSKTGSGLFAVKRLEIGRYMQWGTNRKWGSTIRFPP